MKYENVLKEKNMYNNMSEEELFETVQNKCINFVEDFLEKVNVVKLDYINTSEIMEWIESHKNEEVLYNRLKNSYQGFVDEKTDLIYEEIDDLSGDIRINKMKHFLYSTEYNQKKSVKEDIEYFLAAILFLITQFDDVFNIEIIKEHLTNYVSFERIQHDLKVSYEGGRYIKKDFKQTGNHYKDSKMKESLIESNILLFELLNYDYEEFKDLYGEIKKLCCKRKKETSLHFKNEILAYIKMV